jgi:uncharacterized protein with LGFP repeats
MADQRRPGGWGISRTVLCLVTAVALSAAPVAVASPDSDAGDAIDQQWQASGGLTSPLGPKDGDVYAIAEGFGQNFAGGKIFFTPATGARIMLGAILDKYQLLGGPADSDLGFPTVDEGPGRAGPDSRNTTFNAGDNPVIFWTPDAGAHVVRGAINAAWDQLGGSAGPLGVPVEDETYDGDVVTQRFTGGQLSWNRQTKAFTTVPPELAAQLTGLSIPTDATTAINAARRAAGGPLGPLGAKQGTQYPIGDDGAAQDFAGGTIFFSPDTGANVVGDQVLAKYNSVGGPLSDLGFPTSSEVDGGLASTSRMSTFAAADKPVIFWTPDYGAFVVRGAMNAAWVVLGGAIGSLGAPVADETESGNIVSQRFSGGEISWNGRNNSFTTSPASLADALTGLQVPGQDLPKAPSASLPNGTGEQAFTWHWWYWPIIIAAAFVLAALLAGALAVRRRRSIAHVAAASAAEDVYLADRHWSAETEVDADIAWSPGDDIEASEDPAGQWEAGPARTRGSVGSWPQGEDDVFDLDDQDAMDTGPCPVQSEPMFSTGRHAAGAGIMPMPASRAHSAGGRNSGRPNNSVTRYTAAYRLLGNPHVARAGYPIKGNVHKGIYHAPNSHSYADVVAEIWFATEELAQASGFRRAP